MIGWAPERRGPMLPLWKAGPVMPPLQRPLTLQERGLSVTVGVAMAVFDPFNAVVVASDNRISFRDVDPALDRGANKILPIEGGWHLVYAANDIRLFEEVWRNIRALITTATLQPTGDEIRTICERAYTSVLHSEFVKQMLTPMGYASVEAFRKEGLKELGKDQFDPLFMELNRFDIGVELMIVGFDKSGEPRIFTVHNPGRSYSEATLGYAVIGSGSSLATASIRSRPAHRSLDEVIYRTLEAKFLSETASHVGSSTTVVIIRPDIKKTRTYMSQSHINAIKNEWEKAQKRPMPKAASKIITKNYVPFTSS